MVFSIDLRYFFLPFFNFVIFHVQRASQFNVSIIHDFDPYPFLKLISLLHAALMLILFLFTSITINLRLDFPTHPFAVPVTFAARPITVRFGFFPRPLTLSLLASILLRPPVFWVVYFFIIISSPLHDMLWNALKYIFDWFVVGIRSFSTLVIIFHAQLQDPGLRVEIV